MGKSGIPQKQILEEIMKHTHHIIRLLTLAVVSCALAALLSGCTKEEFIAGYNEFMFGDWFPPMETPPSPAPRTAALPVIPTTSTTRQTPSAMPRSPH